jgi:hypothetical protein
MSKKTTTLVLALFASIAAYCNHSYAYGDTTIANPATQVSQLDAKTVGKLDKQYSTMTKDLNDQSAKVLDAMEKRELKLKDELMLKDTMEAKKLFANVQSKYDQLRTKLQSPVTQLVPRPLQEYIPRLDSLSTAMRFLSSPTAGLPADKLQKVQALSGQLQQLQGKWQQAGAVQDFIKQREQLLSDQLQKYGMAGQVTGMNKEVYYYQQQLAQYKSTLSDPSKMGTAVLSVVQQSPVFQKFMQKNSYLAQLCPMPQNYGTPQALKGVPTGADVGNMIAQKTGSAGGKVDPNQFLQQQGQAGQDQLDALKSKIASAGGGNSNMEIPRFTPNDQKTKSFLHRLEFGFNMQSQTSTVYLPTTTNFAATVGYRINNGVTAGIGVSYAMGWGTGLDHIALSAQGVGVRNYIDIKAKGSIWITGGMEYNYIEPFTKLTDLKNPDVWQKSALLGLTKKYKVGKQTGNVQLLYDFLAHSQSPQGAALKFRVGYTF